MIWTPKLVNFAGECDPRSTLVLVSPRIQTVFRIRRLHLHWPPGCQGRLALEVYISSDQDAPAAGRPTGLNVFSDFGQATYLRGDGQDLDLLHQIICPVTAHTIKLYADNTDFYAHAIDTQIEIDVPGEED